jgi:peptidylprolyl isomerase/peptidyl-prolyl cis-trans isomerase D
MGAMTKIRDNTGVVLWILVIAFGILFMLQDANMFDALSGAGTQNAIIVEGQPVTYDEYNAVLNQQTEFLNQQNPNAGPQDRDAVEEDVFNRIVEDRLREREMDRLGLTVSDAEVRELVVGPNPHFIIRQYFADGQGGVDAARLQAFLDDETQRENVLGIQEYIRQARRQEKFEQLISSLARVSDADVLAEYQRRNQTASATTAILPFSAISGVEVSDSEVRDFYNDNRDDYRRARTLAVTIGSISKEPTAADSAIIANELNRVKTRFQRADDDSTFLRRQDSRVAFTSAFRNPSEMPPAVASAIFPNPTVGEVVGPIFGDEQAFLAKVTEVREGDETFARARHILIQADESNPTAREAARNQIESFRTQIENGASFEALARQFSQDPGSGMRGGDLGWFGRGRMVAPFEAAAFDNPVGSLVGPVETQFGIHLLRVDGRTDQEARVAVYATDVEADPTTLRDAETALRDLAYEIEEQGIEVGMEQAERLGVTVSTETVTDEQDVYPSLGRSLRVQRFLTRADEGDVSEVIELNDQLILVAVREVTPEGFEPLEEIEAEVRARALQAKREGIARQRMQEALAQGGFDAVRNVDGVVVSDLNVRAASPVLGLAGPAPRVVGAILATDAGNVTPVVTSESAAVVARVTGAASAPELTESTRTSLRSELESRRRQTVRSELMRSLREKADVEDRRIRS